MVKKILFSIFCFLSISFNSQNKEAQEDLVEFQKEDGSSFKSYDVSTVTKTIRLGQIILNNQISGFKYTSLTDQKKYTVSAKDVKKVIYYNGNEIRQVQEKIKVKAVDKKGNLSNDMDEIFEFLLYDGEIKLYGSNVFECIDLTNCYYIHSNFYIKRNGEPYAVLAVKPKSQFNTKIGSSIENIVDAFRVVGGNCSSFNQYLSVFQKEMMEEKQLDKTLQKEYQQIYKTTLQELKKDREQFRKLFDVVSGKVQNRQAEVHLGIIKEYEKNCP